MQKSGSRFLSGIPLFFVALLIALPVVGAQEAGPNAEERPSGCSHAEKVCPPVDDYEPGADDCSATEDSSQPGGRCRVGYYEIICPDGSYHCYRIGTRPDPWPCEDTDEAKEQTPRSWEDLLSEITSALANSMIRCPERVWPGYDWRNLQVLLVDSERQEAILWNDQQMGRGHKEIGITSLPYADLPLTYRLEAGKHRSDRLHGVPTLGVGISPSSRDTIAMAMHEGFHFVGQERFSKQNATSPLRGVAYPMDWRPCYLRREVIASLSRAVFSSDPEALGTARYWYDQLLNRHPEEARRRGALDITEGTAQYVQIVGTALGMIGCDAGEAELVDKAKAIYTETMPEEACGMLDADVESYQIGILAGLLLRQRNVPGWQELISKGTTPLDLLLKGTQPIPQADDQALLAKIKKYFEEENRRIGWIVETYFEQMKSPDYYIVAIPAEWMVASFSAKGFIGVNLDDKQHQLVLGMSVPLASPDRSVRGKIDGLVIELITESPRGSERLIVFPIDKKALVEKEGTVWIDIAHLKLGPITPDVLKTDSGREWLFLQPYSLPTPSPAE